jgi:predicted alpha/beta hydrolase family esterase
MGLSIRHDLDATRRGGPGGLSIGHQRRHRPRTPAFFVSPARILILPGYGDSGPDHWQSLWERDDPACRRVVQDDWLEPKLADWLAVLDREICACATPPVLVAHSLACALVAQWAARFSVPVKGALLVAPADVDSPRHTPDEVRGFGPIPLAPLPFPSIVVASGDDPFVTPARAAEFARAWGSRLVILAGAGHINTDAGFGPWPEGRKLLDELLG